MPYYDVVNHVTLTKRNMIRRNARTTAVKVRHQVSRSAAQRSWLLILSRAELLSKSPTELCRGLRSSDIWLWYKSNLVASWVHLHNPRCLQEHLRMLLHSLRALCLAPGGSGSIWKYLEALVKSPGVSGSSGPIYILLMQILQNSLQPPLPSAGVHLKAVSNSSALGWCSKALSPETQPPILSSTCWMRCSWATPSCWQFALQIIPLPSGWLGHFTCPKYHRSHHWHHIHHMNAACTGSS